MSERQEALNAYNAWAEAYKPTAVYDQNCLKPTEFAFL